MFKSSIGFVILVAMMFSMFNLFGQKRSNFRKAERVLKRMVKKKKVPGIAISVSKNGETIWSQGFGYADVENKIKVKPSETVFRIGSVSKPIAASGLAKMVDDNVIDIHKSIYEYLPNFPKKKYDFTLKQLGGHLAGIRNYKGNEFMNNEPLTIKEGVDLFKHDSLLFQPGEDYAYTSYSMNLLSLAMEENQPLSFENYIKTNVLEPLKMTNTFPDNKEQVLNKAIFYLRPQDKIFKIAQDVNNYFKLAGGGYLSTSEDIIKLGNAYLKNDFISSQVKQEFLTSQEIKGNKTYYGIGWQVSMDHKGRAYFGHVGNGLGGYGIFYVYPEYNIVFSLLVNSSNPGLDKEFNKVIDEVFKRS